MGKRRPKTEADTLAATRAMVRTAADERAVAAGCRYDGERAAFACDWIEQYCRLYQGDKAGEPLILIPFWREFLSQLFGWVWHSDEWGGWIRRFRRAGIWAAKKNGKSPVAAAYNLYLLAGDGEAGQMVYMMAGNSKQARISQQHAVEMVKKSPELFADCKINNTTLDIVHLPSASRIEVVTGDDKRSADKKHGYNGSVTVDEMHVVDRQMMEAVERAGISRREPLQASFSTCGMNMDSAGYERFQYGRQVNSGERDDMHFLHVEYCAPDKITDADIDERLDEVAKAANPAWGSLIKPSELRADWRATKGDPRKVALFRMERLNLWVGSTNQWLDGRGWEAGKESYTLADLAGLSCYAAIDLSRTRDMTAFVLCFPDEDGEGVRLWPMFWMPTETARDRDEEGRWGFKSYSHFLHEVRQAPNPRTPSEFMRKAFDSEIVKKAATGMGELVGSDGGFLVPPTFSKNIFERVYTENNLLSRTDQYTCAGNSMELLRPM
jgi:phage terminase large subunit-like protein